jgi:hypothetical protein
MAKDIDFEKRLFNMYHQKESKIKTYNDRWGIYGLKIGDILEGKTDLGKISATNPDIVSGALNDVFAMFSSKEGKFEDFMTQAQTNFDERQAKLDTSAKSRDLGVKENNKLKYQKANMERNILIVQELMASHKSPSITQQVKSNYGHLFTPVTVTPNGVPMFSKAAETQELMAYYASAKSKGKDNKEANLSIVDDINNSSMLRGFNGGEIRFQGGSIWSHLDAPAATPSYSPFSVNAQDYLEKFDKFKHRIGNTDSPSSSFFALDIETFGDNQTGDWFHVNEIAARKFKYDKTTGAHIEDKLSSWLTKPTNSLTRDMLSEIEKIKINPLHFQSLSSGRQRSLVDLMRYSNSTVELNGGISINPAQFNADGSNMNAIHSNALDLNELYSGKTLNQKTIMDNFNSYSEHMMSGLKNLRQNGEEAEKVMGRYNELIGKNKSNFFVTHNGASFDIPGLQKFGESVGVPTGVPTNHLDWMKLEQSVFANPFEMQEAYGRDVNTPYSEGPWTIQEHRRTFGWDTSMGHIGTYDVGKFGTGGIVLNTMGVIGEHIEQGAGALLDNTGMRRKSTTLDYSDKALRKGQSLFSTNSVQNFQKNFDDFQGEVVDGKVQMIGPGFNNNVLDAESFYTSNGVRKLPGNDKYALELLNEATGTYSYVIREGKEARAQIAQFVQQHLEVADDMIDGGKEAIHSERIKDLARRRYEDIVGLRQGNTKGFESARRMYGNVGIFMEQAMDPNGLRSRSELEKLMNFNSLIDGEFNKSEAEQFWHMLPRMQSEHDAYTTAMDEIEKAIPGDDGAEWWKQRDTNMQRSLALRRFSNKVDHETGGAAVETRKSLSYEKHVMKFNDRASGRERSLNLRDTPSAQQGILSYVYGQHGEYKGDTKLQGQVANERYLTLLTSLQESGYMKREQMNEMANDFLGMENSSPAIHAKVLAIELSNNLELLAQIEQGTITSTSLGARRLVENLETTRVVEMIKDATTFASDARGSKVVTGNRVTPTLTDGLKSIFAELDQADELTGLTPDHAKSISQLMERFASAGKLSHGVGMAVTVSKDRNSAFLHIFDENHTTSVLSHLESGEEGAHAKAARVNIPLIGSNGTMRYGAMQLNANSTVIMGADGKTIEKVSSVRKLTDNFDKNTVQNILQNVQDDKIEQAQWKADNTTREAVDSLSGIKRNLGPSDTATFGNNIADILKQGHHNLTPAMARQYYDEGILKRKDFTDNAFDKEGKLKTYLEARDLHPSGMEVIDRTKLQWAADNKEVLGIDADMSSVKSDHAAGVVGAISSRNATFAGSGTSHTRDNSVQRANSYAFTKELQASFSTMADETYVGFEDLTSTPLERKLEARLDPDSKMAMNIETAYMSERDLQDRLRQMKADPLGLELLKAENIIDETGKWNPVRMPTVYEQQIVVNNEILDRLQMKQVKFFDLDEDLKTIEEFMDKKGGTRFLEDGKIGVSYIEQAHKLFFDFEKGTFGSGGGFSLRFLEELTGIKGVGAIIGPDIVKHADYSSLYRGHMNRMAKHIGTLEGEERAEKIGKIQGHFINPENGKAGVTVTDKGTHVSIDEHWGAAGITEINNKDFVGLMDEVGISQTVDSKYGPTTSVLQSTTMAQVSDYSESAGDKGSKVRYGPRELEILRRQGAVDVADFLTGLIDESASDVGGGTFSPKAQAQGIIDGARAIDGRLTPGADDKIWNVNEFSPTPETNRNILTYKGTVLDSAWVSGQEGASKTGAWINLPKVADEQAFEFEGRKVDKVFLPYAELETKGNDVRKSDLQRINERIIAKAQALENMPAADKNGVATNTTDARNRLQSELESLNKQLQKDITSSDGYISKSVLKGQLSNSSSGLTKIISPSLTQELGGAFTYISEIDAKKMDIFDTLKKGEDFYVPDLRYPSFHEKAIRMTKLRMSADLPEGHQLISADVADGLRADSDGDTNHIVAVKDNIKVQDDMRRAYDRQQREVKFMGAVESPHQDYNLAEMGNVRDAEDNLLRPVTELYDPATRPKVAYDEFTSKFGKQLVGMASNLNYQWSHTAMQYGGSVFGDQQEKAMGAIFDFFEGSKGIEQKIISAKHGQGGEVNHLKNPALDMIQALQRRNWAEALAIDENMLGGMFSEKANMKEAMGALAVLESVVPQEQMRSIASRFGLSSGVPDEITIDKKKYMVTAGMVLDVVEGKNNHRRNGNQTIAGLNNLVGVEPAAASMQIELPESEVSQIKMPRAYVPGNSTPELTVNRVTSEAAPEYADRGISKLGSMLDGLMHSKIGVGIGAVAALGMGGLMLSNMSGADSVTPESRPHNDENIQSAHGSSNGAGMGRGSARVEQNGSGLNGMRVSVSGTAPGHLSNDQIGGMASQAVGSGMGGNININSQDDTSSIDQKWLSERFTEMINTGYAGG